MQQKNRRSYRIHDSKAFRAEVRAAIAEQFGGSHRRAAEHLNAEHSKKVLRAQREAQTAREQSDGHDEAREEWMRKVDRGKKINQTTLWRYSTRDATSVKENTWRWIEDLVGPDRRLFLRMAVVSPEEQVLIDRYEMWCARSLAKYKPDSFPRIEWNAKSGTAKVRNDLRKDLARKLSPKVRDRWNAACDEFSASPNSPRVYLAALRVWGPLLESEEAGPVERARKDLSPSELRRYLEAGVRREIILLRRAPALARAQQALASR